MSNCAITSLTLYQKTQHITYYMYKLMGIDFQERCNGVCAVMTVNFLKKPTSVVELPFERLQLRVGRES